MNKIQGLWFGYSLGDFYGDTQNDQNKNVSNEFQMTLSDFSMKSISPNNNSQAGSQMSQKQTSNSLELCIDYDDEEKKKIFLEMVQKGCGKTNECKNKYCADNPDYKALSNNEAIKLLNSIDIFSYTPCEMLEFQLSPRGKNMENTFKNQLQQVKEEDEISKITQEDYDELYKEEMEFNQKQKRLKYQVSSSMQEKIINQENMPLNSLKYNKEPLILHQQNSLSANVLNLNEPSYFSLEEESSFKNIFNKQNYLNMDGSYNKITYNQEFDNLCGSDDEDEDLKNLSDLRINKQKNQQVQEDDDEDSSLSSLNDINQFPNSLDEFQHIK